MALRWSGCILPGCAPLPSLGLPATRAERVNISTGFRWNKIGFFGCYIYPDYDSTIKHVFVDIGQCPHGDALRVTGYFSIDLVAPEGNLQGEEIAAAIMIAALDGIFLHFLLWHKSWAQYGRAWCMQCRRRYFWSQTDYLLRTDHHLFHNVSIWDLRHNLDHDMVLGCHHCAPQRKHSCYLRMCQRFPLHPSWTQTL